MSLLRRACRKNLAHPTMHFGRQTCLSKGRYGHLAAKSFSVRFELIRGVALHAYSAWKASMDIHQIFKFCCNFPTRFLRGTVNTFVCAPTCRLTAEACDYDYDNEETIGSNMDTAEVGDNDEEAVPFWAFQTSKFDDTGMSTPWSHWLRGLHIFGNYNIIGLLSRHYEKKN